MSFNILAVHHSGYSGNIKTGLLSYILEHHRLKVGLITIDKILVLIVDNSLHSAGKSIMTLFDSLDKPFGRIEFLLHKCSCLFLLSLR